MFSWKSGTVFGTLSVVDADDPAYTVPEDDVMLTNSPGFFSVRTEGTSILLTVAAPLNGQAGVSYSKEKMNTLY